MRVTRVMEKDDRIRGQVEGGGWISIESTCKKRWVWAEPMSQKDAVTLLIIVEISYSLNSKYITLRNL